MNLEILKIHLSVCVIFSVMYDSVTLWNLDYHAALYTGLSRQEYWSGLPFPSLGDLPDPEIKPRSHTLQEDSLPSKPPRTSQNALAVIFIMRLLYYLYFFPFNISFINFLVHIIGLRFWIIE